MKSNLRMIKSNAAGLVKSNLDMIKSNCGCGNFNVELLKSNVYTVKSNVKLAGLMSKQ
jgi:hypothetical protein